MSAGIHDSGIAGLLDAFALGRMSVTAVTEHYLERIARLDSELHAFTHVDAEGARASARTSAARVQAGRARPLEGIPVAIKGNLAVKGLPWHGGFGAFANRIATTDAEAVHRLREAGAVILGVLNLHEGALGATTNNPFFGATQNPHRPGFTAGGSSGGSGAAVAAGLCVAALGTDTLGSIRIPAALCGVYGFKPTNGLVPAEGLMPLVAAWDAIGPLARSVEDLAAVMSVLAPCPAGPPAERIALLSSVDQVDMAPAVAAGYRLARDLLKGLGLSVETRDVRVDHHRARLSGFVIAARQAEATFADALRANPQGFSPAFRASLDFGRGFSDAALAEGEAQLAATAQALRSVLLTADAILLPATPQPAFPHAGPAPVSQADFTALANIAGLPAVALPSGWTRDGLPVGVQLMGRAGSESMLLDLAGRLDRALNAWRPPLLR
jgi:aspartyl-tRNA(Asn)/glutamyl-tRNA(Gln) amidotransferase subunit A